MVNSAIRVDPTLTEDQQLRLAREVHQAELALAAEQATAERRYREQLREAKNDRQLLIDAAEEKHRRAISEIQLAQLALRLQADVEQRGD